MSTRIPDCVYLFVFEGVNYMGTSQISNSSLFSPGPYKGFQVWAACWPEQLGDSDLAGLVSLPSSLPLLHSQLDRSWAQYYKCVLLLMD